MRRDSGIPEEITAEAKPSKATMSVVLGAAVVIAVGVVVAIWSRGGFEPEEPIGGFLGTDETGVPNVRGAVTLGIALGLASGLFVLTRMTMSAEQRLLIERARDQIAEADAQVVAEEGFAAIWRASHTRLDFYHELAMEQSKRSFFFGIAAAALGLVAAVACAVIAASASSLTGALAAGGLGALTTALSGYIGATFMRSYVLASRQLRAYFEQAAEAWRYLSAERLVEQIQSAERRDEAVAELAIRVVDGARTRATPVHGDEA